MWSDFRYALRQWKRSKGIIAIVIFLLGIGIGANTLIFSFVNAAILRPLPVRNPANLFVVEKNRVKQTRPDTACLYRAYEKIRARKDLFSSAVASQVWSPASFQPFDIGGRTKLVSTNIVSPNYFSELGVNAIIGRRLTPADATITSGIPVVISEQFWKSQMDGSRSILGRTLRIKNYPFQIVGVMPKDFHGLDIDRVPNVWMPISAARIVAPHSGFEHPLDAIQFQILVRLAPGVTSAAAAPAILRPLQHTFIAVMRSYYSKRIGKGSITQAQLDAGLRRATQYKIKLQPAGRGISRMRQKFSTALYVLMGAVGLLLLAVCASVSGMLLAKAEQRKREIAIRVAIGARPARLLRQTFAESLLWTIPSAGLALVFFYLMSPVLVGMLPEERGLLPTYATPQALSVSLDHRVVLFVIAVCLLTIFLSGLGAAWRATRMNVVEDLKQHQQNRRGAFSGIVMVAIQVGISVVLVAGAVLMVKTFWTLQHLNPGFDRAHIVEVDLNPQIAGYSNKRAVTFMRELRGETALLPGVRSVAGAHMGIMQGVGMKTTIAPEGEVLPKKTFLNTNANSITPGYFRTLGIPLLAGRTLRNTDRNRKPHPVMVNEAFAKKFFPHQNPIGKAIVYGTNGKKAADSIIVGVVGTAKYRSLREKNPPIIYGVPATRAAPILYARTFGNPKSLLGEIRKLIHTRDPNMPIIASATLEQEVESSLWQERLLTLLSGFFAIIALALAAAGIYGALAYSVAARTREIGIRMAIGAQPRDIVRTVCGRLFAGIAAGLIIGTVTAALLLQISQKLFFGVQGFDVTAFLIAIGCILLCAALAALFPAYRAIKTDPVSAMRLE